MKQQAEEFGLKPVEALAKVVAGACYVVGSDDGEWAVAAGLSVTERDESEDGSQIMFTRSDGEIFHLWWLEEGHAALEHNSPNRP